MMILQAFRMSGALSHFTLRKVHPFDPTVFIAQKEAQLLRHLLPAFSLPLACPINSDFVTTHCSALGERILCCLIPFWFVLGWLFGNWVVRAKLVNDIFGCLLSPVQTLPCRHCTYAVWPWVWYPSGL